MEKLITIVPAAGLGKRLGLGHNKAFALLGGQPLLVRCLAMLVQTELVQEAVIVVAPGEIPQAQALVDDYRATLLQGLSYRFVEGGRERQDSVANALATIKTSDGYVAVHDGARPFLTEKILEDTYAAAVQYQACVAAVQSKDTVKISDGEGFALSTPDRRTVWNIQTPQVFETSLILQAYERLKNRLPRMQEQGIQVTDDASVVELFTETRVKLVEASYQNIKITTPEDMKTAEAFLED